MENAKNNRQEFVINFIQESKEKNLILLDFILEKSNILCLTRSFSISLWPLLTYRTGGDKDPLTKKLLKELAPELLKIQKVNKNTQHFYKIDQKIVEILKNKGLMFWPYEKDSFYGFENPTFYSDDVKIASIITHENIVLLYLNETEQISLKDKGFTIESTAQ